MTPSHAPGRPTAVVVQNTRSGGPGRVGVWLREAGIRLHVLRPYEGEALPRTLDGRPLLVLGGGFLPDDDERAPWLPATRRLVAQALDESTPVLGICLGSQLLAQVAGGIVRARHGRPEFGSTQIRLRPEAADDPLLYGLGPAVPAIERHVDAITELPPDAVWLASSEACPHQAFRVGARAWGVQFHPEAEAERIAGWDRETLARQGFDRDRLHARAVADEGAAVAGWSVFTRRFAQVCARLP
ncbi:type 1 glutamine amidotransferase [Streptomyces pristinaespiralis]|uniref:Aminotransferase n=1 Tax=Streptomyces pristinaespiralis TaxID=38300 RepID=A0A0M4DFA0_STRPR|nr:type 1 glutamine amidotransferase [Streptomyces pristinaespiralis]ALC19692.1 aminotransferase [Streptomyces pristinaespiralis]QMU17319.1 type 1 glutamine amidotransferase [Streptomyces pristinaespiralis]